MFAPGDPRINRKGRPKGSLEKTLLLAALKKAGRVKGKDFWQHVAEQAYIDSKVLIAVVKKFVPDVTINEHTGEINFNKTPDVILGDQPLEYNIGSRIVGYTKEDGDTS